MRIGFRTWNLHDTPEEFQFRSVAKFFTWKLLGVNQAGDETGAASRPVIRQNSVGLYHYYDADKASAEYEGRGLLGACMCWGRIAGKDGERMFRSQFAQIVGVTEPNWQSFPRPPRPSLSSNLAQNLWMIAVNKERSIILNDREAFRSYAEALCTVVGMEPGRLDIGALYEHFERTQGSLQAEYSKFTQQLADWEAGSRTWSKERSERFRASMPFPVFQTVPELVAYAQKFGELGPPDRTPSPAQEPESAPEGKAFGKWWDAFSGCQS